MGCIVSSTAQHEEPFEVEIAHPKALSCTISGSHQSNRGSISAGSRVLLITSWRSSQAAASPGSVILRACHASQHLINRLS